jgi:DNA-binding HxlR family transcriptional regulator
MIKNTKDAFMKELTKVCPLRYTLGIIGGKWKLPIICLLATGKPMRYGEIKRKLKDITNMMLSQSLKELEAGKMVTRKQYNEIPPKVEYALTDEAKKLIEALTLFASWGHEQIEKHNDGITSGCAECQSCEG